MSFVSNVIWLTVVFMYKAEANGKFCRGFKGIERLEGITLFTEVASQWSGNLLFFYSTLHSLQVKKNGNVAVKNYTKESFLSLLCFIIHGKRSSEKGFKILNCENEIYLIAVVSCLHARN